MNVKLGEDDVIDELFALFTQWRDKSGVELTDGQLADFLINSVFIAQEAKKPDYSIVAIVVKDKHGRYRFVGNEQYTLHVNATNEDDGGNKTVWSWYELNLDGETYLVDGATKDI